MENLVSFRRITKFYGEMKAVHELDLDLAGGEFITLLGPSGCGKSTTLRMLGGFEIPSSGQILLNNQDITALPPHKRDVNMVFQDYALFPHLTVAQNVAFSLELKRMSAAAVKTRVQELLVMARLEDYADRRPEQLSGGQRQRVALVRSLAPDPTVLLLDEPLGALDAKLRGQMQIELRAMQRRTGKTFLFVTHDQEEALTISDRVVVMNRGRIEQSGTPKELYYQPKTRFVATFIGENNLLTCDVVGSDGSSVSLLWHGARLVAPLVSQAAVSRTIDYALRPENVSVTTLEPASVNKVEAVVTERIFKGSLTTLICRTPGGGEIKASLDSQSVNDLPHVPVWLSWDSHSFAALANEPSPSL